MPNYKCIKDFKSKHGKLWKVGEVVGLKWYECMEKNEKTNFEFLNDFFDMPPKGPQIATVPVDEEPFFIGTNKQKVSEEKHIATQEERPVDSVVKKPMTDEERQKYISEQLERLRRQNSEE